jgi:hypothetical protein
MPPVGFEPTNSVLERAVLETVQASNSVATVIGSERDYLPFFPYNIQASCLDRLFLKIISLPARICTSFIHLQSAKHHCTHTRINCYTQY